MQLFNQLCSHCVQLAGSIQSDLSDPVSDCGHFDFSHEQWWHDYIETIITEGKPPLTETTLLSFRHGRNDPTCAIVNGDFWRATYTPMGPATVRIGSPLSASPTYEGFGPGGTWLAARAQDLLGLGDELVKVAAVHTSVVRAQEKFGHLRLGRSWAPYHELLPAVLGQRVTGIEAMRQWSQLTKSYGLPAPGPLTDLRLPPDPELLRRTPYFELHALGIEKKRADALRAVARSFDKLIAGSLFERTPSDATQSLQHIDGIGPWTAAVAGGLAFGDPDALLVGDFHVKNTAAWALRGVIRGTDEEMIEDMRPYLGQRHRVMRWLELDGWRAPARGPRQRIVSIARL